MNLLTKIAVSISILLYSVNACASSGIFFDPLDGQFDASRYLSENAYGFLPVPVIITEPAVDGGLGMIGLFFHETEEEKEARLKAMQDESNNDAINSLLPPSVSAAVGVYTGNNSSFVGGGHVGFFKQGRIRYMGGGGVGDVNLDFYGFGDIQLPKPIAMNTQATAIMQTLKFKLGDSNFFLGPLHRYINADLTAQILGDQPNSTSQNYPANFNSVLSGSVVTSGAGLILEYDSRDNFFSPADGLKYELNHLWYHDAIGSDIDYQLTEFSGLNYFKLNNQWRTAFRFEVNYADSERILPPFATPYISMRGIPFARYQGQAVAMTELEVIYKINLRWEVNAFAGVGKASDSFSEFSDSSSRVTQGAGFRYLIARRYGFDMGIDIAKGPEDTIFYIQAGTAW